MEIINGTIRLLGDRILLRPLEWDASKIIIAIRHGRPVRGEILAVGPGHNPIKYRDGRSKMDYSKRFRPTQVRVGEIVELGWLNAFDGQGFQFQDVLYNGVKCIICTERDVAIVRDDEAAPAMIPTRYMTREEALAKWPMPPA